ncbi:MAG: hypothetical protein IPN39_14795 [Chitinophagaceae bacterium]|nr:hypothetical protein [Chitinophagaceae bacterium]
MSDGSLAFGDTNTTGDHARGAVSVAQTTGGFMHIPVCRVQLLISINDSAWW